MPNQNKIVRKQTNLVYKRGISLIKKSTWIIGQRQNLKMFYVSDYDNDNIILWGTSKQNAIKFKTERSVNRFVHKHLKKRTNIILMYLEVF